MGKGIHLIKEKIKGLLVRYHFSRIHGNKLTKTYHKYNNSHNLPEKLQEIVGRTNINIHEFQNDFMEIFDFFDISEIGVKLPKGYLEEKFKLKMSPERFFFHVMISHNKNIFIETIKRKLKDSIIFFSFAIIHLIITSIFLYLIYIKYYDLFGLSCAILGIVISLYRLREICNNIVDATKLIFYQKKILTFVRLMCILRNADY